MNRGKRSTFILYTALAIAIAVATAVRVAPLVEGGERLQRQCVSEDGYLMLTIARNFALGRGFSISDGQIPTNGTQPLSALLYALCFLCTGGDKVGGLYLVVGLQVITSIVTAMLLFAFAQRYLYKGPHSGIVALLAATVWYASPTSLNNTQNSLETGLCALLILLSIVLYDAVAPRLRGSLRSRACVLLGLVLGITFLGRNDTCFLIAAMLVTHLFLGYKHGQLRRALAQSCIIGAASFSVALPWLWFNVARFGHPVPVSGRAESLNVTFAHNLAAAFAAMAENLLLVLRIPAALQDSAYVQAASAVFLLVIAGAAFWKRRWLAERFSVGMGVLACFTGALFVYYGLFFGMPSFLGRYFFPAVMLCAIVAAAAVTEVAVRLPGSVRTVVPAAAGLAAAGLCLGLDARVYLKGREHLHFQVVDWVAANVPDGTWVGAVQTGTLGFYHDRTINLDGKVDPYAFAARKHGRTPDYVVQRDVAYIVDWAGIASWAEIPQFAANYELMLVDRDENLAVLRRRTPGLAGVAAVTPRP